MEEKKCVQSGENFKRVKCFVDLDVNGRIKLNRSSNKRRHGVHWINLAQDRGMW
jgi:hypothetical protein